MSSARASWVKFHILYKVPHLFKRCSEGNMHWFWHRFCWCRDDVDLHDMKTGQLYNRQQP